jgi:hypothetical protein
MLDWAALQDWELVVLKDLDLVSRTVFIKDGPTPHDGFAITHALNRKILARIGELIELRLNQSTLT